MSLRIPVNTGYVSYPNPILKSFQIRCEESACGLAVRIGARFGVTIPQSRMKRLTDRIFHAASHLQMMEDEARKAIDSEVESIFEEYQEKLLENAQSDIL
jgi:hypothetical protein